MSQGLARDSCQFPVAPSRTAYLRRIGLRIGFTRFRRGTEQCDLEPQHDGRGDLVLHGEDVVERAIVRFRQKVCRCIHSMTLMMLACCPALRTGQLKDVRDVEPFGDLDDVDVLALENAEVPEITCSARIFTRQIQQSLQPAIGRRLPDPCPRTCRRRQYGDRLIGNRRGCLVRISVQNANVESASNSDGGSQRCNDQAIEFLAV